MKTLTLSLMLCAMLLVAISCSRVDTDYKDGTLSLTQIQTATFIEGARLFLEAKRDDMPADRYQRYLNALAYVQDKLATAQAAGDDAMVDLTLLDALVLYGIYNDRGQGAPP